MAPGISDHRQVVDDSMVRIDGMAVARTRLSADPTAGLP